MKTEDTTSVPTEEQQNIPAKKKALVWRSGKECAYLAVFVALVIAAQLLLASIPGVEVVTLLFVVYSFVFGVRRGMISATAFSLLRMLVFGFSPTVLILYLFYFNGLTAAFGGLGKVIKKPLRWLWLLVLIACACTAIFNLTDAILTPLWYAFSARATQAYFLAMLPFMIPQIICTAVSVGVLFIPLQKTFAFIKRGVK